MSAIDTGKLRAMARGDGLSPATSEKVLAELDRQLAINAHLHGLYNLRHSPNRLISEHIAKLQNADLDLASVLHEIAVGIEGLIRSLNESLRCPLCGVEDGEHEAACMVRSLETLCEVATHPEKILR